MKLRHLVGVAIIIISSIGSFFAHKAGLGTFSSVLLMIIGLAIGAYQFRS